PRQPVAFRYAHVAAAVIDEIAFLVAESPGGIGRVDRPAMRPEPHGYQPGINLGRRWGLGFRGHSHVGGRVRAWAVAGEPDDGSLRVRAGGEEFFDRKTRRALAQVAGLR